MASIHEFQERAKQINPQKVKGSLFQYIRKIEHLFFQLNIEQLEEGQNAKGGLLKHKNKRFSGLYTEATEEIAKTENPLSPKIAGQPYNFLWTGDFLKGFEMFIKSGSVEINSTGTGSKEKAAFFNGFKDLFGLTDDNLNKVIEDELLPHIIDYYKKELEI